MISEKLAHFYHLPTPVYSDLGKPEEKFFALNSVETNDEFNLKLLANLFYDPYEDHINLKESLLLANSGECFDNLRKTYRKRREFQVVPLKYDEGMFKETLVKKLNLLQFRKF